MTRIITPVALSPYLCSVIVILTIGVAKNPKGRIKLKILMRSSALIKKKQKKVEGERKKIENKEDGSEKEGPYGKRERREIEDGGRKKEMTHILVCCERSLLCNCNSKLPIKKFIHNIFTSV